MKELFNIFGIRVYFFGVMIGAGMLAGAFFAYREVKRKGLNTDKFFDLILYTVISSIIGARLFYVIFYNLAYYLENPLKVINIAGGGLSIHGGLFGAFIAGFIYIKKNKMSFFKYADAIAPGIILGQGIGRVGCDVFGRVMKSDMFWGIQRKGMLLHPVQVYEFILDYIVLFILLRKRKSTKYDGQIFIMYIILYSINRSVVELFRNNPDVFGLFSVSHLLNAIFIVGALITMYILKKGDTTVTYNNIKTKTESSILTDTFLVSTVAIVSVIIFYNVQG